MNSRLPAIPEKREDLEQMPKSVLVELVLQQQKSLEELITKVERLQGQLDKDSQTSSKPPSSDLIKRSEKKSASDSNLSDTSKRQPGGQPGHKGKTRKGFGRIDRYEVVEPVTCQLCGGNHFEGSGASSRCYVVAQLVERPIEIVEYRQVRRHFKQVETLTLPHQEALARAFLDWIDEAFDQHRQWREVSDELAYTSWAASFKMRITQAIETWLPKAGYAAGLLLKSLTHKSHQWWYFLDHLQVPPDNNRAERSLRLAVTRRKVAGGSRSRSGFRRTATLLSAIESCPAQGRLASEFFSRALSEAVRGQEGQLSRIPRFD